MSDAEAVDLDVSLGTTVYDEDGDRIGTVQGFDEHGVYVTTEEGIAAMSSEHLRAGAAGEAELVWRCYECGTMDDIEALPEDGCPDCGAPQEDIYYLLED